MVNWHIGCSGFHYRDWRGPFYPENLPQRKWFDFYCKHFSTIELNVTFYRFPRLPFLEAWYWACPPDFRFAVKAPRAITHYKKFNDCTAMLASFYDTLNNGLQEKLGPVLFQLPPIYIYDESRFERIINNLNPAFHNVLEPRHVSWWQPHIYAKLAMHNISFCGMSHPALPDEVVQNTGQVYYRFHGVPDLYRSRYEIDFLKKTVDTINADVNVKEAWCYFNNDYDAVGVLNAKEMIELTG